MTLFSSVTVKDANILKKMEFRYLLFSLICMALGRIYEYFSHSVYSDYMVYAFVFPLVFGVAAAFLVDLSHSEIMPGKTVFFLYNAGIATLTVGSVFKGVLEIYGTTNRLSVIYWIAGAALIMISTIMYIAAARKY